jgi:hypothetical protein
MVTDILIGGVDDRTARVVETAVRRAIVDLQVTDVVTVAVLPSDAPNRWDVGVRRAAGWSVTSVDAEIHQLSTQITETLRNAVQVG